MGATVFSLRDFYERERSHLPLDFNPAQGVRALFPAGYAGSIGVLRNYVFASSGSLRSDVADSQVVVRADGAGRWLFAALIDYPDTYFGQPQEVGAILLELSFAFHWSNDGTRHGRTFVTTDPCTWMWSSGVDPWIRDHWPTLLQSDCKYSAQAVAATPPPYTPDVGLAGSDVESVLGGSQQTVGAGTNFGQNTYWGTGEGNTAGGLPASAESGFSYDEEGGGSYPSGRSDPWWDGFAYPAFSLSLGDAPGTGLQMIGPDPQDLVGNPEAQLGDAQYPQVQGNYVMVILLNNTVDTILMLLNRSAENEGAWTNGQALEPPRMVLPGSVAQWSTESDNLWAGTSGSAQYLLSRAGAAPDGAQNVVTFNWDDPEIGSNSYSATAPTPYTITQAGGHGDTAVIIFDFREQHQP